MNSIAAESLDYRYVISGCADSTMKLWDVNVTDDKSNYQCIASIPKKSAHKFGVSCVEWWPQDTGMFVSASFDHTVKVWDTNVLEVAHEFDMTGRVYSFDISASQALVAVAIDHPHVRLVDLRSTASSHTLPGHRGKTLSVKWHPHMENVVATGGFDGEIKLWDIRRSNSCIARLDMLRTSEKGTSSASTRNEVPVRAHLAPVNGLVWDLMGQLLLSAGNDDKIRVWDLLSNLAPPINKLINFGPLTRNKYPQNIPMLLNSHQETELSFRAIYLCFGSLMGRWFRGSNEKHIVTSLRPPELLQWLWVRRFKVSSMAVLSMVRFSLGPPHLKFRTPRPFLSGLLQSHQLKICQSLEKTPFAYLAPMCSNDNFCSHWDMG